METTKNTTAQSTTKTKVDLLTLSKVAENLKEKESTLNGDNSATLFRPEFFEKHGILGMKSFRRKQRTELLTIADKLKKAINRKDETAILKIYNDFKKMYFEAYLLNDFSVKSIRSQIKHESERKQITAMMDILKAIHESK